MFQHDQMQGLGGLRPAHTGFGGPDVFGQLGFGGMFGQRQNRLDYAHSLGYGGDMSGLHQYFQQLRQAGGTPIRDFRASEYFQPRQMQMPQMQPQMPPNGNPGPLPPGMGSQVPAQAPQLQGLASLARRPGQFIQR